MQITKLQSAFKNLMKLLANDNSMKFSLLA